MQSCQRYEVVDTIFSIFFQIERVKILLRATVYLANNGNDAKSIWFLLVFTINVQLIYRASKDLKNTEIKVISTESGLQLYSFSINRAIDSL